MSFKTFKIMGERNSGTNFATQLVTRNYEIKLRTPVTPYISPARRRQMRRIADSALIHVNGVREKLRDDAHRNEIRASLGWKHAQLMPRNIRKFKYFDETLTICVVRHPATWLRSMHRYPAHALIFTPDNFSKFIRKPWLALGRDEFSDSFLSSVIDLWLAKNRSYEIMSRRYDNVVLLRYEELLRDPEAELARLPLERPGDALDIPNENARSFRPETETYADYQARLAQGVWAGYNEADRAFVTEQCGALARKIGFDYI